MYFRPAALLRRKQEESSGARTRSDPGHSDHGRCVGDRSPRRAAAAAAAAAAEARCPGLGRPGPPVSLLLAARANGRGLAAVSPRVE